MFLSTQGVRKEASSPETSSFLRGFFFFGFVFVVCMCVCVFTRNDFSLQDYLKMSRDTYFL